MLIVCFIFGTRSKTTVSQGFLFLPFFLGKGRSKSGFKQWVSGDFIKQIINILLLEQFMHYFPSPDERCCFRLEIKTLKVMRIKVLLHDENSFILQIIPSEA